jgi:hypothetical protein
MAPVGTSAMTRDVRLHLDEFGQQSLDRLMREGEGSPAAAFRTAALYYLADRDAGRPAWRAPRFRPKSPAGEGLRVVFDDDTWAALEEEAARQNVGTEELAVHALLYFLADFDSGRITHLLEKALEDENE